MFSGASWNLDNIIHSSEIGATIEKIEARLSQYASYYGNMSPGMDKRYFAEFVRFHGEVTSDLRRLQYRRDLEEEFYDD